MRARPHRNARRFHADPSPPLAAILDGPPPVEDCTEHIATALLSAGGDDLRRVGRSIAGRGRA